MSDEFIAQVARRISFTSRFLICEVGRTSVLISTFWGNVVVSQNSERLVTLDEIPESFLGPKTCRSLVSSIRE